MSSAVARRVSLEAIAEAPQATTLLDLVRVLGEITEDDREVVATALSLLRSGRVRLCGNFLGAPLEDFGD